MTAVDLGAAPDGWTWQLVNQHMRVIAVDNGPMVSPSGRASRWTGWSATSWKSAACTAVLVETWLGEDCCREVVLPMKQRYAEVTRLLQRIEDDLKVSGGCKQLYHDREEEVAYHLRRL